MSAAAAIAAYHDRLLADESAALEQAAALEAAFVRSGVTYDGAAMRSFLRPHFLDRSRWDSLRASGRALLDLAARVARRAFGGDVSKLMSFLGTPESEARFVAIDPGEPDVVWSRLDAFLGADGPHFVEINSDAPAGFGYGDRMAAVFQQLPVFREIAARFAVSYEASAPALVQAVLSEGRARGAAAGARVAIVDFADVKTRADQEILREEFEKAGVRAVLGDPRDCIERRGRFFAGEFEAEIVFRRAVLSELVARPAEVSGFLAAYASRAAVFVNSFRCRLSEDKAFFALLTDEAFADLMTAADRALVFRVVPWTRRIEERRTLRDGVSVDLVPHALASKDDLVLKPTHGHGGESVLIGSETAPDVWERAIVRGTGGGFVVQARQQIPEEPFPIVEAGRLRIEPRKLNVNPFYVRGASAGAVARASQESVINVSAGGGSVPSFVVD